MGSADTVEPGAVDADVLQFIAEGVTELAGFRLAAISVVHDGRLHTVAIAGDDTARAELSQLHPPVSAVLAELEQAEDWGPLKFVPHERETQALEGWSYVPDFEPDDDPGSWHPRDMLLALLEDSAGTLRGILSVDLPVNGRHPDADQRRVLELYARQAGRAVIALLERDQFERGMRRERATSDYRGQLIDALSHQLQNPVAAISGNVELLLEELPQGDPSERSLRSIERATGRIQSMVGDLLALAKLNNPERPLHEVDVDLAEVARVVAEALAAEAAARAVALRTEVGPAPLVVRGDPGELEDLVSNLVANGVKYSDAGGAVTLTAGRVEEDGTSWVELRVADRGIGISEEDRGHLFEEFFRSSRPEARGRPGTGLGLTVVDRVLRRHRGRVEVDSTLGAGTTFRVLLSAQVVRSGSDR